MKLFFALLLVTSLPCFSQNRNANSLLTSKYNHWLKTVQLGRLIEAVEIKTVMKAPGIDATKGQYNKQELKVLVLKPAEAYADPADFLQAWDYIKTGYKKRGINIYELLLNKFAAYAGLPLDAVMLKMTTADPDYFSCDVYFDRKLVLNEHVVSTKGGEVNIDYNFDSALKSIITGDYILVSDITDLKKYSARLENLFIKYHNRGGPVSFTREVYDSNCLQLKVTNIYGQITGENYHEIIHLTVNLFNLGKNQIEVRYYMDVFYAGGLVMPPNEGEYRDAANDFGQQLAEYNTNFAEQFKQVFK